MAIFDSGALFENSGNEAQFSFENVNNLDEFFLSERHWHAGQCIHKMEKIYLGLDTKVLDIVIDF